ncbi:LPS export ABC transporter periplasmic protein LptC [Hyphococcus formosus]|uniref:LPS export ABC transporter periplasmic protein LptC n=1 Tax=Hyphococcus formosus TaxID=3143534 RepID=UPI00398BA4EC
MNSTANHQNHASDPPKADPQRRVLDSLPMEARTTGDQAAARSRLVRRLRVILPITALVLVAAFFFNTQSNTVDDAFLEDFKDISASAEELRMASPKFVGTDGSGKPFEISADTALQHTSEKDTIELEKPRAVQGENSETTVVTAEKGVYRTETKVLELRDSVTLEHEVGDEIYIFRTPAATVSIDDEIVTSDTGIGGSGPDGRALKADKMKAYNSEGRVVFEGNVHMRIYPKNVTSSKDEPNGANPAPELKDPEIETPQ